MEAAMDLMRRMPRNQSEAVLSSLLALLPQHLSRVDQPLQILRDSESGQEFLLCDYNRGGDWSPWSSNHPPLDDGSQPSAELRKLEMEANDVLAIYVHFLYRTVYIMPLSSSQHNFCRCDRNCFHHSNGRYYEGGISSVYVWDPDEGEGFAACFLIKKGWDGTAHYSLTSTIMLSLTTSEVCWLVQFVWFNHSSDGFGYFGFKWPPL